MGAKKLLIALVLILSVAAAAFFMFGGEAKVSEIPGMMFDTPEAKNCVAQGGTVEKKTRGDGKGYEVCLFEDDRQCEALSLLNNECPKVGVRLLGYITDASIYCAILGGDYERTVNTNDVEDGTCSFFSGKSCNVWDLYNGKCEKGIVDPIIYNNAEFNFSLNLPREWEGKYEVKEEKAGDVRYFSFDYGEANLFKVYVIPYSSWEKEKAHEGEYLDRDNSDVFAFIYSKDPLRSDKQWGEEYLSMVSRVEDIKDTFKITKPYVFLQRDGEEGDNYDIQAVYPVVGAVESGKVNIEIGNLVAGIVSRFKEQVGKPDAWKGKNTLKILYETYEINSDFISIRFDADTYTGGGDPASNSYGFNYDLKKDRTITLDDVFNPSKDYVSTISERSIKYLLDMNKSVQFSEEDWIRTGASPKKENFQAFTFNREAIIFHFDPLEVGSFAAGRQDVIFPFSSLKDIVNRNAVTDYGLKQ